MCDVKRGGLPVSVCAASPQQTADRSSVALGGDELLLGGALVLGLLLRALLLQRLAGLLRHGLARGLVAHGGSLWLEALTAPYPRQYALRSRGPASSSRRSRRMAQVTEG